MKRSVAAVIHDNWYMKNQTNYNMVITYNCCIRNIRNEKPTGTYHSCRFFISYFLWGSLTDIRSDCVILVIKQYPELS